MGLVSYLNFVFLPMSPSNLILLKYGYFSNNRPPLIWCFRQYCLLPAPKHINNNYYRSCRVVNINISSSAVFLCKKPSINEFMLSSHYVFFYNIMHGLILIIWYTKAVFRVPVTETFLVFHFSHSYFDRLRVCHTLERGRLTGMVLLKNKYFHYSKTK